jgi:hypothetical protein
VTSTTEPQSPSDPGWVSRVCIAWVIDEAPCPTELLPVLTTIARRCNNDGTGSYQSKATLAKRTGKSRDQVEADVKRLLELRLIRKGDQSLLDDTKIPEWQRPVVYDVALEMRGEKPTRAGRNKSGKNKRTEAPGTDTPGGTHTPPGTDTPTPGGTDTPPPPGMDTPQISLSKNPSNKPSSLSARTSVPTPRETTDEDRERDDSTSSEDPNLTPQQRMVIDAGCPEHLSLLVVENLEAKYDVRGLGWWRKVKNEGDLPALVQEGIGQSGCGNCTAGKVTTYDQYDQPIPTDCPACTPMTAESRAAFTAQLAGQPTCPEGYEGGNIPMPGSGWMRCADCRRRSGYVPAEERNRQGRRRERGQEDVPPGYTRRPDGRLILTNSHDPRIDWDFKV